MVLSSTDIFFKISLFVIFLKTSLGNISGESSSLDPDHAQRFVGPDLCRNCLQRLSADDTIYISKEFMATIQVNKRVDEK